MKPVSQPLPLSRAAASRPEPACGERVETVERGPALSKRSASNGPSSRRSLGEGGFTLVELLVGVTLSGAVMAAVLSSYVYLGRSFGRLANQQILETEARRALTYFTKDVQSATGISGTPSASTFTLVIPTTTGTTTTVAYAYNSSAGTFTRTPSGGTAIVLLRYITSSGLTIKYYDASNYEYTSATLSAGSYLTGIKQLSLEFSTQAGLSTSGAQSVSNANGTQTRVYSVASGRVLIHNSSLLQ